MSEIPPPELLADMTGWEQTAATVQELFSFPGVSVNGHTLVYERDRRFFFVTRLEITPSVPVGVGELLYSTILDAAKEQLEDRLAARGGKQTEFDREQPLTINETTGQIVAFQSKRTDGDIFDGYLAVFQTEGFRIAGGAYPHDSNESQYKDELFELIGHIR